MALDGDISWKGLGTAGKVPVSGKVLLDANFPVQQLADAWRVGLKVHQVRSADLDIGRMKREVRMLAETRLQEWLTAEVAERSPVVPLVQVGAGEAHVLDARVKGDASGLRIELLTKQPVRAHAGKTNPPKDGWQMRVADEALLAMARAAAFRHGEIAEGIALEPTSFKLDGDRFRLGVRIWKLQGRSWWLDAEVEGEIAIAVDRVVLKPEQARQAGASPRAVMTDPVAWLGRGHILKAIEDGLAASLPAARRVEAGDVRIRLDTKSVEGKGGDVVLTGKARVKR